MGETRGLFDSSLKRPGIAAGLLALAGFASAGAMVRQPYPHGHGHDRDKRARNKSRRQAIKAARQRAR